ncbi:TRPM8 channel-associated factor 2 [Alligator mississippiensis]|uniref:TRPM8 channel-associated factor 2 n=1 Tax=Alligator mississippiensis TaxID=8496 RepID=UPI0009074CFD|nr:TRPM8 channel-associated factor 2 [Alligator mississippiensis]
MDSKAAYNSLVKGIDSFNFTEDCQPCELLITGDKAFPVVVSDNGQVLIAASQYGKGRLVVISHEGYLGNPRFSQFLQNAVNWLRSSPGVLIGVHNSLDPLSELLLQAGTKVQAGVELSDSFGVYCTDAYDYTQAEALVPFVKRGGGLLIGGQAWHWASQHGVDKVLFKFPGNQVTSVAGVYFTGNMGELGTFSVFQEMPKTPLITQHGLNVKKDLEDLLNGVVEFDIRNSSVPSPLLVHGSLAFPIGFDSYSHQSLLAAAHYGWGRIVVIPHESYMKLPEMRAFILNAIYWLDAGKGGLVGIGDDLQDLFAALNQKTIPCKLTDLTDNLSVYCCTAYSAREAEKIHEFVAEGGGLLIGGQAWVWASRNSDQVTTSGYPGNKILHKFGLGILGKYVMASKYSAVQPDNISSYYHFRQALFWFQQHLQKKQALIPPYSSWLKELLQDSTAFLKISAQDNPSVSSIHKSLAELITATSLPDVSKENPIKTNSVEAVLISLATVLYNTLPEFQTLVHVPSQNLPAMPVSPPVTIQLNGSNEGRRYFLSTGFYIPPGETATLVFPAFAITANLKVQIGCHSDNLSNTNELKRPPVVIMKFKVETERMKVSTLWGGLIYVLVPRKCTLGQISVTIEGAVQAPFFKLGETSTSDWQETIRLYPAPWAELAVDNVILTVPADSVRQIQNPETLLSIWDLSMKAVAELAAIPATFPRPERIVADVQISAGWMHAGYPVMVHLESVTGMTDVQSIKTKGFWGPIHELGHNQQQEGWEFPPHTTEATCNLWPVYVHETVLGIPRDKAHEALKPEKREQRIQNYINNGAQLKGWNSFTALETYLQLQEAFGWEAFIEIFFKYQEMPYIPRDKALKMNLWVEMFSQQVKKNLAPFFKAWGWPIEENLSQQLADSFPIWSENPMERYISQ